MKNTILITGASRGIGAGIARAFAMQGHRVAIHYCQHRQQAEQLCAELQNQHLSAMTVQAEISDASDVKRMVQQVRDAYGAIDVLVNNAGMALPQKLLSDCTENEWERIFSVNCKGMYLTAKAVIPQMVSRKHGVILNISSMWGVTGGSCEVPYSASKAGVIGFTKSLAKELAPSGIRVNCIAPGFILTDMNAALSKEAVQEIVEETPLLRAGSPEDVANTAIFLTSDAASFITGEVLHVDGGRCI